MREWSYKNLDGRNLLIDKLVEAYMNSLAADVTIISGNHGSGKSYVLFEVITKIQAKHNSNKKIKVYFAEDDRLTLYNAPENLLDDIEMGISLPLRWGIGLDISTSTSQKSSESQFNHICNLLKKKFSCDILICLPKYTEQDKKIKLLVNMLITNLSRLKKIFKHKMYFLISDLDKSCLNTFMDDLSIDKIVLEDYEEKDILEYLVKKHKVIVDQEEIVEKIKQIKKICASNLKLVDFLYVDFVKQNLDFFRALDSVVSYRINQLKKDGLERNVSEYDMEDIILTSSISLKSFGSQEIAMVSHKSAEAVRESLQLANKQVILKKDSFNFYDFICEEIQLILKRELICKNKERYLDYYNYYTEQEQDQYYLRAYYLWAYNNCLMDDIFALLILAYSEALNFNNLNQIKKIEELIIEDKEKLFIEDYNSIKSFYSMLKENNTDPTQLKKAYNNLQKDYFEILLKAELARVYFLYMYKYYSPWDIDLKHILNQIVQYAQEPIYLSVSKYPIQMVAVDEAVLRLRIIYDIAPYILDAINDADLFAKMYDLSSKLSNNIRTSQSSKSIAKYMENVFNRKAFLFVNQTQCNIFYDKAKKYFYDNQIWDEYCITLICEAGTDIVIQKYKEALQCCWKAKQISLEKEIEIPQPQKLRNNIIIADFFRYEEVHSPKNCFLYAKKVARKLQKCLLRVPCATEFVIITNICSLYLYAGDVSEYIKYKKYLERLIKCDDVSDVSDDDIDDFYRYYFAWFEAYRYISEKNWIQAKEIAGNLDDFVPALFKKQEVFWEKKLLALKEIIDEKREINGYDFSRNLVPLKRRASELAKFFCRGLMLSDIQYTSYD